MPDCEYQQSAIPLFGSAKMEKLAKHLWDMCLYYFDGRAERDKIVEECDSVYLCERFIPDVGTMQLLEDGPHGDTDIFDYANTMANRAVLSLMGRNDPWLTVSGRRDETQELVQALQDLNIFKHKKWKTRRNYQRFWKQKYVRGRSAFGWEWNNTTVWRRISDTDNRYQVKRWLARMGMSAKDAGKFTNGRYPHVTDSGALVYPIDYWDLWLDPLADLVNHRRPGKVLRKYFTLAQLKSARDPDNPLKKVYNIPDDFEPTAVSDLLDSKDNRGERPASQKLFNRPTLRPDSSHKLVPVYIVYVPELVLDNDVWFDTYFYLARNAKGGTPVIIKVEENPSDLGHSHILVDDHIDWFTPTASGGISGIEKLVPHYHQKNLMKLLMITAAAMSIAPAQLIRQGALKGDEASFAPGAANLVDEAVSQLAEVMRPVPVPERGVQLGEQLVRFMGEDLRAMSGIDGLIQDNAARNLGKEKTATEVNRDAAGGSLYLDNQAENDIDLLNEFLQAVFETMQQRLEPGADGMIEYERSLGERVITERLKLEDLQLARSVQVTGVTGATNKEQELQNILKGLETVGLVSQTMGPQIIPFIYEGFLKAWRRLGIQMPEGVQSGMMPQIQTPGMPPGMDPQQAAIEQAMSDPNVLQLIQGGLMNGAPAAPEDNRGNAQTA